MPENQHIEWKSAWRDEYLKWICGFANADGGMLVIGRNDRGAVEGVDNAGRLLEEIPNKARDILGVMVDVNLVEEESRECLEITVEPYPNPVSYKGEYYYRSGSTNQLLRGAALDRFLLRRQGRHWDGAPLPNIGIKDLSKTAMTAFRKRARESRRLDAAILRESVFGLIEKLHLSDGPFLKRAAALLFHPDPERFFTGSFVKIGFFRKNTDLLYQDEVHGDLFTQVEKTMDLLLTKYLQAGIAYQGLQRVETFPVPEAALREAILNAVVHKDYGSGTPIQISVYPDKIMLWNSGGLPPDWTVERLLGKHPSQPFNPDIANAFFRAGMIEAWGRGIERMMESCRNAKVRQPEVRYEQSGLWIIFHFRRHAPAITTVKTPVKTPVKTTVKTPEMILAALRTNPGMTLKEVAASIGKSLRAVERAAAKLTREGRLRYIGPRKGGHWEVNA